MKRSGVADRFRNLSLGFCGQQAAIFQQAAEVFLAGEVMLAGIISQFPGSFVRHLKPFQANDADEFMAMLPNLALSES